MKGTNKISNSIKGLNFISLDFDDNFFRNFFMVIWFLKIVEKKFQYLQKSAEFYKKNRRSLKSYQTN